MPDQLRSVEHLARAIMSGDLMDYVEWWRSDSKRVEQLRGAIQSAVSSVIAEGNTRRQAPKKSHTKANPKPGPVKRQTSLGASAS
jgi:hypothetical protein